MDAAKTSHLHLSRRERQIMDALYKMGRATVAELMASVPEAPGYSAMRAHLRTLEEKGHVRHAAEELRYVYAPTVPQSKARRGALRHLVETFFGGSPGEAAAALLDGSSAVLSREDLDRLSALIERARQEGK